MNDLGYSANDLMNVSFVFIVEGKQDRARLPLLLKHYYGELYDEKGNLKRVAIISTNSCTNIKTYANLKYINQLCRICLELKLKIKFGECVEKITWFFLESRYKISLATF